MIEEIVGKVGVDIRSQTIEELKQMLAELEKIPVADVKGGRQRTSKENEKIAILRALLRDK